VDFRFSVQIKIQKPVHEVFEAVYDPKKLSGYFTSGGSDGPLDEGKEVLWSFRDGEAEAAVVPVIVLIVVKDHRIRLRWAASEGVYDAKTGALPQPGGYDTTVEMTFESLGEGESLMKITEGDWRQTQKGLEGSYQNCVGWTQMACSLKAYLEYGINLRKGSF